MGQVSPVGKVQTHKGIPRLQAGHHHRHICLGTGMGLHICIFSIEKLAETVDSQLFYFINHFASAIIPGTRITLRILVGANGTKCIQHLLAYIVF